MGATGQQLEVHTCERDVTTGVAATVCRQHQHEMGFETCRQLNNRFSIPCEKRSVGLLECSLFSLRKQCVSCFLVRVFFKATPADFVLFFWEPPSYFIVTTSALGRNQAVSHGPFVGT